MTEQETIRWLSRAYWLKLKIEKMQEQRSIYAGMVASVKGMDYGKDVVHGGSPSPLEDAVLRLVDLDAKLAGLIVRYSRVVDEVTEVIGRVEDERLSTLLYLRYVKGERMEKIACEMSYAYRHIKRLHRKGIRAITQKISENEKMSPNVPLLT